ncbi:two-component system, NarL family, sensor histidine kinase DegS [Natronincola peptidivorans]|uniref:Oxygen sensor histidine kinase NreB n=1 Tax=Natronincola peptidivorans TaxID=426128 RepID=A0A1I0HAN8_9FIRM|nr:sensor histidine kinase [Natronincola peptidivorans]SET80696.1 two-component system, NarL family, sensor histidine kinase DegS [Natronincola peptidivorans]
MNNDLLNAGKMNEIFSKVLNAIEESKSEVLDITENIRKECNELKIQLEAIKENVLILIKEVDVLEKLEKNSRRELLKVSRDFEKYKEKDIKEAYEKANALQIQLILKRQQEKELIKKRTETEVRLKNTEKTLEKADTLSSRIGIVQEFLGGNLQDLNNTLEDIKHRHFLGRKIIHAQEEERKRVARDIHDGPAQSLANLVIKAEICEKLLEVDLQKSKKELKELKKCTRESIKDIRKIIYNLRPMSIDDLGFITALQRYVEKFQNETNIVVDFVILSEIPLEDSIKSLSIFRIVQEALNNIRKHANAFSVAIRIEMNKKSIGISIKDDGVGFNLEEIKLQEKEDGGFGLLNIKERVELLNGNLKIESEIKKGTTILVNIPRED